MLAASGHVNFPAYTRGSTLFRQIENIGKKPAKPLLTTSAARKGSTQNQTKRTTHLLEVQISRADDAVKLPTRREMKLYQQQ